MANKRSGLARPDLQGAEGMFGDEESSTLDQQEVDIPIEEAQKLSDNTPKSERIKRSLTLSPEAHALLDELPLVIRKIEGEKPTLGEVLDRAIIEYARKVGVLSDT